MRLLGWCDVCAVMIDAGVSLLCKGGREKHSVGVCYTRVKSRRYIWRFMYDEILQRCPSSRFRDKIG